MSREDQNNPLIAGAFFRSGDIEAWGRGIETIADACRDHGAALPTFESDPTGMTVEFKGEVPDAGGLVEGSVEKVGRTTQETSVKSSPKTEERILDLIIEDDSISTERIGELLGISKRAVLKQTRKLQDQNRLKRVGAARGGHWEVIAEDREQDEGLKK